MCSSVNVGGIEKERERERERERDVSFPVMLLTLIHNLPYMPCRLQQTQHVLLAREALALLKRYCLFMKKRRGFIALK